MKKEQKMDDAVSPVVGVMLMLVVTIIIAALVSAFAGGLADTSTTLPNVVLKGTYSQSGGLVITHAGGDAVLLTDVSFRTIPSESMGPDHARYAWGVNKSYLLNNGKAVLNATSGKYDVMRFSVGDTLNVEAFRCMDYYIEAEKSLFTDSGYSFTKGEAMNIMNHADEFVNGNSMNMWGGVADDKSVYLAQYEFRYPGNLGSYFYLDMVDPTGSTIARAKVTITG